MKNAANAVPKIATFIPIVCAAFFSRVKPVSTSAKPPCMNITRAPPMQIQSRLTLTPRPPTPPVIAGGWGSIAKADVAVKATKTRASTPTSANRRGRNIRTRPPPARLRGPAK